MMDKDETLNQILQTRRDAVAPQGLSAWIIAEAQDMPQEKARRAAVPLFAGIAKVWRDLKYELFGSFAMPQPAVVFALLLCFGFSVGLYGEAFSVLWGAVPGLTTDDLSGFMYIGDSFTAQEF